jgi:hypothetical protein
VPRSPLEAWSVGTSKESVSEIRPNAVKTRWGDGIADKGDSGGALVCGSARRYEIYARLDVAAAWLTTQGVPLAGAPDAGAFDAAAPETVARDAGR